MWIRCIVVGQEVHFTSLRRSSPAVAWKERILLIIDSPSEGEDNGSTPGSRVLKLREAGSAAVPKRGTYRWQRARSREASDSRGGLSFKDVVDGDGVYFSRSRPVGRYGDAFNGDDGCGLNDGVDPLPLHRCTASGLLERRARETRQKRNGAQHTRLGRRMSDGSRSWVGDLNGRGGPIFGGARIWGGSMIVARARLHEWLRIPKPQPWMAESSHLECHRLETTKNLNHGCC